MTVSFKFVIYYQLSCCGAIESFSFVLGNEISVSTDSYILILYPLTNLSDLIGILEIITPLL